MDAIRNNLPLQLSSFIGREREMGEVRRLLASSRLVTLTGAGGCGKTRLALAVAAQMSDDYADGVWFIDLAPLSDPALVAPRLAATLNVREQSGQPILTTLLNVLNPQRVLLVLDNREHLLDACAPLAQALLQACPRLTILATSREALRVEGEVTWPVAPLSVPPPRVPTADLSQFEAVQLFVARAATVQPQFALDDRNAAAVADICRRLDGIPLALELAAALVNALSPDQIAARLGDVLPLLTEGKRTALPRQQTLEATIAWSHRLLTESERVLLRRLSVFVGGWNLAAAEAVCGDEAVGASTVLAPLIQLVNQSLVLAEQRNGETRYRMLETIRQFAHEQLAAGEEIKLRDRHLEFFARFVDEAGAQLSHNTWFTGSQRLALEQDNWRAALSCGCGAPERLVLALRMVPALANFWRTHDLYREGVRWLDRLLALSGDAPQALRAPLLAESATLYMELGEYAGSRQLAEESLSLYRALQDPQGSAYVQFVLGRTALNAGEYDTARRLLEENLVFARTSGSHTDVVWRLFWLGLVAFGARDFALARSRYEESLALCKIGANRFCASVDLNGLGDIALQQNDLATAAALYEESLVVSRKLDLGANVARLLNSLAHVAGLQGLPGRTVELIQESLSLSIRNGHQDGIGRALELLATLAAEQGQAERAAQLWGAIEALFASQPESSYTRQERLALGAGSRERAMGAARAALGEEPFADAWFAGRALSMAKAIAEARQVTAREAPNPPIASQSTALLAGLTAREVEVLRWLVRGLSDNEIAKELVISPHTVHGHLRSIYSKLDVTSRAAAIHVAHEMKLV